MTITLELPTEMEHELLAQAAASGKDVGTLIREAVAEKLHGSLLTFAQVLSPVHEEFRKSGMTTAELDSLLEQELAGARKERRERQSKCQ